MANFRKICHTWHSATVQKKLARRRVRQLPRTGEAVLATAIYCQLFCHYLRTLTPGHCFAHRRSGPRDAGVGRHGGRHGRDFRKMHFRKMHFSKMLPEVLAAEAAGRRRVPAAFSRELRASSRRAPRGLEPRPQISAVSQSRHEICLLLYTVPVSRRPFSMQ